jgi:hypothetical protein
MLSKKKMTSSYERKKKKEKQEARNKEKLKSSTRQIRNIRTKIKNKLKEF